MRSTVPRQRSHEFVAARSFSTAWVIVGHDAGHGFLPVTEGRAAKLLMMCAHLLADYEGIRLVRWDTLGHVGTSD